MPDDPTTLELEKMREDWDQRARENARYYVASGQEQWSDEEYFRSGEINVEREILTDLGNVCQGKDPKQMRVLEIGCGTGRITRALAEVFRRSVRGGYQRRDGAAGAAGAARVSRTRTCSRTTDEIWPWCARRSGGGPIDFAFSYIVFQHIPSRDVIENYVREVQRPAAAGRAVQVPGAGLHRR